MVLLALVLVFGVWYPAPLHQAVGVAGVFILMLGVDVAIGPMLTFVVFKPGKKTLKFDLATIVTLQLLAFGYGLWIVAEGRPAWLVFNVDRFDLVQAYEIDASRPEKVAPEYRHAPWLGPAWVAGRMPDDVQERNTLTFESVFAGVDIPQRPDLYQPLAVEAERLRSKARPLDDLLRYNSPAAVQAVRERWTAADAWLPLMSKVQPVTVLLRKDRAEVVAVVALNPWN